MTKARTRAANRSAQTARSKAAFVTQFIDQSGVIDANRLAATLRVTDRQLAETAGFKFGIKDTAEQWATSDAQTRLREMLTILSWVLPWAGSELQAMAWYRAEPVPALGGRTPEALVKAGEGSAVLDYLDQLSVGGFA